MISLISGAALILLTLGIVMLYSASALAGGATDQNNPQYFFQRQLIWLVIALCGGYLATRINYRAWRRAAIPFALATFVLLVLTVIPGIGTEVKGSSRWLRLGPVNLQPSEFAKLSTIILMSWWMAKIQRRAREFVRGMLIPSFFLGAVLLLIFIEPDFGTTMLIALVGAAMMFVVGVRLSYLVIAAALGLTGFFAAVMHNAERWRRIIAFLNPEKYEATEAWQLLNAKYAFVLGGGLGVGLGQSVQKRAYLPEAHTDFIYAIMGEELGLALSLLVLVLFIVIFVAGLRVSVCAPESFGKLLAFGITMMITVQACLNIGVVTGCLPTKGLPLPFISFGGSSLIVSVGMIGILINIAKHSVEPGLEDEKLFRNRKDWA